MAEAILGADGRYMSSIDTCTKVMFDSFKDVDSWFNKFDVYVFDSSSYWDFRNVNASEYNHVTIYFIKLLEKVRKFVITDSCMHAYGNAMMLRDNIIPEINRLKTEEGKDILLLAGEEIIKKFTQAKLVDEIHLYLHPQYYPKAVKSLLIYNSGIEEMNNGYYRIIYKPGGKVYD